MTERQLESSPDTPRGAVVRTAIGTIWLGMDGVVRGIVDRPREISTLEDARDNLAAIAKVSLGRKRPVLSDGRRVRGADRAARRHFAEHLPNVASAYAVLLDSPLSRMLINLLLRIDAPKLPSKVFTDENDALQWLYRFVDGA
ncbi:MAG: hypothetical protein OEZ06_18180 [Myxococcales bacterium]|nr:hypothetical protein [Myxococcales bacterium]